MTERFGARTLAFIALTIILASILGFAVYQLRHSAKAVATIAVNNGALEELISGLIPDFAFSPPTAESVAAWFDDDTAGSIQTVTLDSDELAITVWATDSSQALLRAQELTANAGVFFDALRQDLMQDVDRWFKAELARQDDVLPPRLSSDEQNLFDVFQAALIAAETEACWGDANPATIDVSENHASGAERLLGASGLYQQPSIPVELCHAVADDLDKLRKTSRADDNSVELDQTMRSTLIKQRASLMVNEAWTQPASWVRDPGVTVEPLVRGRLHLLIPGIIALSILVSLLMILLYSALANFRRDRVFLSEDDQIFSNPHWPVEPPEKTLGRQQIFSNPYWPSRLPKRTPDSDADA